MREGKPSRTALAVALFRAIASQPGAPYRGVADPLARAMLTPGLGRLADAAQRVPFLAQPLARLFSGYLLDHVALRTAAIDAEIAALAARRDPALEQVVILGAGFDTRAYRMTELASARVLEVDVAATQARKKAKLGDAVPACREVRFVEVDFARNDLDPSLEAAGHVDHVPTTWIWEGVMPYLRRTAATETLRTIARSSAPGSRLLVTYMTPEIVRGVQHDMRRRIERAFTRLGEPLVGEIATAEMHALLSDHGLEVHSDSGSRDWAAGRLERRPRIEITERLACATRTAVPID
jgi:methyltransferase (TIGR00027 family)